MTKTQKLRNLAEGFMAALVACGYSGPWRWAHHQWEGAFYRAWEDWPAHTRGEFPALGLGGSANGHVSQARDFLMQLNRTSPFAEYTKRPLTPEPMGMSIREYLDERCAGATAYEWTTLAQAFLDGMSDRTANR